MTPGRRVVAVLFVLAAALVAPAGIEPVSAKPKEDFTRWDVLAADTVLARGGQRARDLEAWAARAPLADLVWILRRSPNELGASEGVLARAALAKAPADRAALRARLAAMAALAAPDPRAKRPKDAPRFEAPPLRPRASAFRVAALLPDSGDYADYARSVWFGLEAGLRSTPLGGARRFEVEFWGTGDDDPQRVAGALEAASVRNGVLVGELLSVHTLSLATGARLLSLPIVSPTATDEAIGRVGAQTFQIGPSGWSRGERLARAMIARRGMRAGVLTSGEPSRNAFARGFLATAESLGAVPEWRYGYSSNTSFREEVRQIAAHKLDVLLWDGEPREIELLLRELSKQKVAVQICGGEALAPERVHAETRVLMEGVRYVSEEWRLEASEQARLDSALASRRMGQATPLHMRGWLAGRAIAAAVAGGALCPEEVTAALAARVGPPPWLGSRRFLDVAGGGGTLPLFTVQRGRGVRE